MEPPLVNGLKALNAAEKSGIKASGRFNRDNLLDGLALALILAVALAVRLWGIGYNLPYIHFLDEMNIQDYALDVARTGDLSRAFPYFAPFHTYIQAGVLYVFALLQQWLGGAPYSVGQIDRGTAYLIGRLVVAAMGTATVYVVYRLGHEAYGRRVGLVAAALLSTVFVHVTFSQYIKNDVPVALFDALAVLFAVRIVTRGGGRVNYILSGLFVGIAAATHYPGAVFLVALLVAHGVAQFQRHGRWTRSIFLSPWLVLGIVAAGVGFVATNPLSLLNFQDFLRNLTQFAGNVQEAKLRDPSLDPAWLWYPKYLWSYGLYWPLSLAAAGGIAFAVWKRRGQDLVLLSAIAIYALLLVLNSGYITDRISVPLTPFLCIVAARLLTAMGERAWALLGLWRSAIMRAGWLAVGAVLFLALPLLRVAWGDYWFAQPSALQRAQGWIQDNLPPGSRILVTSTHRGLSPNPMEADYKLTYSPQGVAWRPVDSLSLSYDYVLVYSSLPQDWERSLAAEAELLAHFEGYAHPRPPEFLKVVVTGIRNDFYLLRTGLDEAKVYELVALPRKALVLITEVTQESNSLMVRFRFVGRGDSTSLGGVFFSPNLILDYAPSVTLKPELMQRAPEASFTFRLLGGSELQFQPAASDSEGLPGDVSGAQLAESIAKALSQRFDLAQPLQGEFVATGTEDLIGTHREEPSGRADWRIRLVKPQKPIAKVRVQVGTRVWVGPPDGIHYINMWRDSGAGLDVYFEPAGEPDQDIVLLVQFSDGRYATGTVKVTQP